MRFGFCFFKPILLTQNPNLFGTKNKVQKHTELTYMFLFRNSCRFYRHYSFPIHSLLFAFYCFSPFVQADESEIKLEDVHIFASKDNESLSDIAQPVLIINRDELQKNAGQNLGTLLENVPGMGNASFGPGVGRPVIRGMQGSRVKILQNGHDSADLSAMSSDHAPMADVHTSSSVEVIQGPSTLRYGGGAIGGIVNVLDDKIHQQPLSGVKGYVQGSATSPTAGHDVAAGINMGNNAVVLHLDGFNSLTNNYQQGKQGRPKNQNDNADSLPETEIKNSDTQGKGGSVGLTWTPKQDRYLGASISTLKYEYGVPNDKNAPARVRLERVRYDVKSKWDKPLSGIASWQNQLSFTDYKHDEYTAPIVEGLFDKKAWELTSSVTHEPVLGWRGSVGGYFGSKELKLCHDHSGCKGLPYHQDVWNGKPGELLYYREGFTFAHDTPMPNTNTHDVGLFVIEKKKWQQTTLELGARMDKRTISMDENAVEVDYRREQSYYSKKSFTSFTLSTAGTWHINHENRLALSLARAQRAPEAEELYWNGDHHATFSYQLDNPSLKKETAYTADINWQYTQENRFIRIALYHYVFDGYIYNDRKKVRDPYHLNAVYKHEQRDASFSGGELTFEQQLTDQFAAVFQADTVTAQLTRGKNKNLPRIPPASMLFKVKWNRGDWSASLEDHYRFKQTKVADNESVSNAFNTINAYVGYTRTMVDSEFSVGLQLNNLLDSYGKNHVSYLKDFAPEDGRNVKLSARFEFL